MHHLKATVSYPIFATQRFQVFLPTLAIRRIPVPEKRREQTYSQKRAEMKIRKIRSGSEFGWLKVLQGARWRAQEHPQISQIARFLETVCGGERVTGSSCQPREQANRVVIENVSPSKLCSTPLKAHGERRGGHGVPPLQKVITRI